MVLPYDRLLAVVLIWAFLLVASVLAGRGQRRLPQTALIALIVGLAAARLTYVGLNWQAFAVAPLSILAVWQGGFTLWAGIAAAGLVIFVREGLRRSGAVLFVSALALAAVQTLVASTVLTSPPKPFPQDLTLATMEGTPVSLDSLRGRPFVINLWATWCPPCRREMPMLVEVASGSDIPILLANQGEGVDAIRQYFEEEGWEEDTVFRDPGLVLQSATGSPILPSTLFVDADGMITRIHTGELSRAGLLNALKSLRRPE
ncbi:TlpA family protein disulfide reductase [Henriciella aquimarina]|uniref:TlpA family protein disulfide reductase n=1 Tax=Henriciella aquimarina TaxID=545261 RepID=UPI0009FC14CC|nr:TlpA family protein disulfide reductase [Henriciella aquimarina]